MEIDMDHKEIDELEVVLDDFKQEWELLQNKRSAKWRKHFVMSFIIAILFSLAMPSLWWSGIFVIGYFAGSLFVMLRRNAKTSVQINEHQKQLKLVRLLRNFQSSPYSSQK